MKLNKEKLKERFSDWLDEQSNKSLDSLYINNTGFDCRLQKEELEE